MTPFQSATLDSIQSDRQNALDEGRKTYGPGYADTYYFSGSRWVGDQRKQSGPNEPITEFARRVHGHGVIKKTEVTVGCINRNGRYFLRASTDSAGRPVGIVRAYAVIVDQAD